MEDDENDSFLIREFIKGSHLSESVITHAQSYQEAVDYFKEFFFDLLIIDVNLQERSGHDVLGTYRVEGGKSPVIMLTSCTREQDAMESLRLGASDYIDKNDLGPGLLERAIRFSIQRNSILRSLEYRSNFEKLITKLSAAFIHCESADLRFQIQSSLEEICCFSGSARGSVFSLDSTKSQLTPYAQWHQPDVISSVEFWRDENLAECELIQEHLSHLKSMFVSSVDSLADRHPHEFGLMEKIGLEALIIVPLDYSDDELKLLVFEYREKMETQAEEFINLLPLASEVFNNALRRETGERLLKQKEMELRHAQKMEAIGELSGGIAHDFNNMLVVIGGYSDLILSQELDERVRSDVEEIQAACERAASVTRQLLAFSRRQMMQPQKIDLNDIVINLEKMLERLIGDDITFSTECAEDLSLVFIDPGQLEQVIVNLIINARDALPDGGEIKVKTLDLANKKDVVQKEGLDTELNWVLLEVEDNGVGMSPQVQEHVFKPFFTTKRIGKGTGLGLSTVYGIIKQSSGVIKLSSHVGLGSRFSIYLPSVISDLPEEQDFEEIEGASYEGDETVLVVDSDASVLEFTARLLRKKGYRPLLAHNGSEAEKICRSHDSKIDLVLLDVIVPHIDGHELERRLKRLRGSLKVIYVSGYPSELLESQGLSAKNDYLLFKPYNKNDFFKLVRGVLDSA